MKKIKLFLLTASLFISCIFANAQDIKISGVVKSSEGEPLPGAAVIVKGTKTGVNTDLDGAYTITAPANGTLVASNIGFIDQEIAINSKTTVNFVLDEDKMLLDDVVVVAYGSQSAKTVTASVASIKSDVLKDAPNVSFDQMLQGQAAGVQVSTPSAGVGQTARILVRGVSSISGGTDPLYIVDGIPINSSVVNNAYTDASALSDINPNDILSLDVLKDAAATALYGSRAANGVVIITTKKGQKGAASVTYDVNVGVATPTKTFDMMDDESYVSFMNLAVKNKYGTDEIILSGSGNPYGTKAFNRVKDSKGNYLDTDWAKLIYKNGLVQNHTVAIQGGTDKTQYYISANYSDQDGIVIGDSYTRYGAKANVSTQVNNWLKIGLNSQYTYAKTESYDGSRQGSVFAAAGLPRQAMIMPPIVPAYNEDGSYNVAQDGQYVGIGGINMTDGAMGYPNAMAQQESYNDVWTNRFIGSGFAEVTPLKGLTFKTQFGIDYMVEDEETFWNPHYGQGVNYNGMAYKTNNNSTQWTWTNTADYNVSFGEHTISALIGMEANENSYKGTYSSADDILNDAYTGYAAGYSNYSDGGYMGSKSIISYFGRLNYDYKAKYMASVNYRRDGLSSLGSNNRWGNFYGASAAWRISEEPFFSPLHNVISDLKIKGSYGVVGNSDIGYYNAQTYYEDVTYGGKAGLIISNIGDENLAWETSTKYDFGFQMNILNNIDLSLDYYYTKSSNLVMAVPQGPSTGIGTLTTNAGALKNDGFELTIGANIISTKDFSWYTNFNLTTSRNEVTELAEGVTEMLGDSESNITLVGYSLGQLYLYPTGGIDSETGRRIFYGSNGERTTYDPETRSWYLADGTEFQGDISQVRAGNTLPTYYGGWTNTFKYKGFDLNIMMQYSGGNWIYNGNSATGSDYRWWNKLSEVSSKCWMQPGDNAKYARPYYADNVSNGSAYDITDWVEKGDFLRMKTISLGYTYNANKAKLGFSKVRVYAQVQNAFVITGYSGLDPEITSSYTTDAVLSGGFDKNTLPQARTWTLGAQLTF